MWVFWLILHWIMQSQDCKFLVELTKANQQNDCTRLNTSPNRPVLPILLWPNAHSLDSRLENVWLGRATQHKVRNCCCSGFCKAKQECRHCEDAGGVNATPGKQGNIVYWQAKRQRSTLEWQSMVPGCCGGSYSLLLMTATRTLC